MSKVKGTRFAQIPEWVIHSDISDKAVRLYCVLARVVATERQAMPNRKQMAEKLLCSPASFDRALLELIAIGAVTIKATEHPITGARTSNDYRLHFDAPCGGPSSAVMRPLIADDDVREDNGSSTDRTPDRRDSPLPQAAIGVDFEIWWQTYPSKHAKKDAVKAWPKAVRAVDGDVQRLIDGAARFRDDPNREDRYTPYPATWLNGGRWDDDPLPPKRNGKVNQTDQRTFDALAWANQKEGR